MREVILAGLGGSAGSSAPTQVSNTNAPTETKAEETKVEDKPVEKEEESAEIGGLFGDDDDDF